MTPKTQLLLGAGLLSTLAAFSPNSQCCTSVGRTSPSLVRISHVDTTLFIKKVADGGDNANAFSALSNAIGKGFPSKKPSNSPPGGEELRPDTPMSSVTPRAVAESASDATTVRATPISVDDGVPSWFPSDSSPGANNGNSQNGSVANKNPWQPPSKIQNSRDGNNNNVQPFRPSSGGGLENKDVVEASTVISSPTDPSPADNSGGMFSREAIAKVANGKSQSFRRDFNTNTNEPTRNDMGVGFETEVSDDPLWWKRDEYSPSKTNMPYNVPQDNTGQHLLCLVGFTLWWYVLSSLKMIADPPHQFFGLGEGTVQLLGLVVALSQVGMFVGCTRLTAAETLEEAQGLVRSMAFVFVPVNLVVSLINPFEAKGITVLACAEVTLCLGIFLSHYLRKASYRELPPYESSALTVRDESIKGMIQYLNEYRPPPGQQATHSAVALTRSFTAFAIATGTVGQYVVYNDLSNPIATTALIIVALHSGLECLQTTMFPGVRLDKFTTFLGLETALYSVHMLAATLATAQAVFVDRSTLDNAWDQGLFLWLFLNALVKVMAKSSGLLSRIDFDRIIGLADLDKGEAL